MHKCFRGIPALGFGIGALVSAIVVLTTAHVRAQDAANYKYFYDSAGQLIRVVDFSGVSIEYVYDSAGNIVDVRRSSVGVPGTANF